MRVVFWQNIPSPHQAPALDVFCELWPDRVHAVWCAAFEEERRALGWQAPAILGLDEIVLPASNAAGTARRLMGEFGDAIHVMSGLHAYPPIVAAFEEAVRRGFKKLALMVEGGVALGWRGFVRPLRARWLARQYRPYVRCVLAMGIQGVYFYRKAGFSPEVLFPYMYQCEVSEETSAATVHDPVRLVYVGKFIRRKGVDVMLRGLARCRCRNWRLTIIGDGVGRSEMQRLACQLGLTSCIEWIGAKRNTAIPGLLARHDLCLIPSRFEGWGVVCNEAIQAGLGVLCSDTTASREITQVSGAGRTFQSRNVRALAASLEALLGSTDQIYTMKGLARRYRSHISPSRIGRYLKDVLSNVFLCSNNSKPYPPWLNYQAPGRDLWG